jgi:hypothetical protein
MTTLTIELHDVTAGDLPDADTDCLIFDSEHPEAQLGAWTGKGWIGTQGESVEGVHTWAHMPCLPVRAVVGRIGRDPDLVPLPNGRAVDLNGPWALPR